MHDDDTTADADQPGANTRLRGAVRLGIGLAQGVVLWGLNQSVEAHAWPSTQPAVFAPLLLVCLFAPLIVIQGLGRLHARTLALWTLGASVVLAGLGVHDALRTIAEAGQTAPFNSPLIPLCIVGLFIAHSLVAAADHDGRPVGLYPSHFELAWKHGLQSALGVAFVGVFWALLWLGAALFSVIGIEAFRKLLEQDWFYIPATTVALAAALNLTDVRVGLIRGVRTVALTLLSWLTPMMALIAVGFLAALPVTGLGPLFETRAATAILLSAAAVLIVLINTIYQDGDPDGASPPPLVLRWTARAAALTLAPITAIAGYALALRIGQYGLTPERIIAAAFVALAAVYAVGYAVAALLPNKSPAGFMKPLEPTNVAGSYVALACLLALLSPVADPARLSVDDQLARLKSGAVTPDTLDYRFLRHNAARYGREALEGLKRHANPVVREKAAAALADDFSGSRFDPPRPPVRRLTAADIKLVNPGKALPAAFLAQDWSNDPALPDCDATKGEANDCRAILADFDRDGAEDILIVHGVQSGLYRFGEGRWRRVAAMDGPCSGMDKAFDEGRWQVVEPALRELEVDGRRLQLTPEPRGCWNQPRPPFSPPLR